LPKASRCPLSSIRFRWLGSAGTGANKSIHPGAEDMWRRAARRHKRLQSEAAWAKAHGAA
jgi:hypothetical protein